MLAWAPVIVSRILVLFVLAAALMAIHGTLGGASGIADRIELPSSSDGGDSDDDGDDVPFFSLEISSVALPVRTGSSFFDTHRAPAVAPSASRIFRPPISPLA